MVMVYIYTTYVYIYVYLQQGSAAAVTQITARADDTCRLQINDVCIPNVIDIPTYLEPTVMGYQ